MKIGIVILHWNNYQDTLNCVKRVLQTDKQGFELETLIIDNASRNDSFIKLKKEFPKVTFIQNPQNLGFAAGNNVGIKHFIAKKANYIFILNNDTLVSKSLILELIKTQKEFKADIVSPKIYFTKGYEFHKDRYKDIELGKILWYAGGKVNWKTVAGYHIGVDEYDKGQFNKERIIEYATGAALFMTKKCAEVLKGFDERYYLYYEDIDFCMRAKAKGMSIIFSPESVLWHNNAGSTHSGSSLQDYYITRNRLLFGKLYASFKVNLHLKKEAITLLFKGREWQKKGVEDYIKGKFGKGSYE